MKFQKPKGTKDILPRDIGKWHYIERTIGDVMKCYNFCEIRTPTFENTELFVKGTGEDTDIVGKEMYTFKDKGGNSLTLKPEGTAPVIRASLENGLLSESPINKMYYISSMFRHEKPQAGRFREHTHFGAEILGSEDILSDMEIILIAREIYFKCGVKDFQLKINSIGKLEERKNYLSVLKEYLSKNIENLSEDSKRRLNTNPLRILDSKDENDIKITDNAPQILDYLSSESRNRFNKVIDELRNHNIDFLIDYRLVRGHDYYTDTTFEFISKELGAQDALGGGGRYDKLVENMGGKPTTGVGFGSGIERLIIVAEKNNFRFPQEKMVKLFVITLNDEAKRESLKIITELRNLNIVCDTDLLNRSLKAQMREANKQKAEFVYIIGDEELKKRKGVLKKMVDGMQTEIHFNDLRQHLLSNR